MTAPLRKAQQGRGRAHVHAFGLEAHFSELSFMYPLKLISPSNSFPGRGEIPTAIAYVLSYGGGLVGGDRIDLSVQVDEGVGLVFLTQGSTKVFKSRSPSEQSRLGSTSQHLTATVSPNSLFLLLPDPVTCFQAASYTQIQTINLALTASLVLLDWLTSGRMARGEEWAFERYYSRNEVWLDGKRVARDVMLLEQAASEGGGKANHGLPPRELKDKLAPYACYATLLLLGPRVQSIVDTLRTSYNLISQRQRSEPEALIWSLSPLGGGGDGICVRIAATETEMVKNWLKGRLEGLSSVVGEDVYNKAFV